MTATALKSPPRPQAPAPGPGPARRRGFTPLTPMRHQAARSMSRLADSISRDHPDLAVHQHVRDAARMLRAGDEEAAQRHLRAAMFSLTPQSLLRNGVHDDSGHLAARSAMHGVHRHLLLVKDIADTAARNQAAIRRDSYGDDSSSPPVPEPPVHSDPDAGYGPGALAQRPVARQPGGDRALNAPDRTNSGGSDPAAADPVGRQPKGSKQFARTWDELASVLEFSAKTAALEVTPAPRGKPGGGLYDVKGLEHVPYFQQVVKALIEKRGMPPGKAYAIAYGALRKWERGGSHIHPEVRAAAASALAGEKAKGAMAKAIHGHANTWDELAAVIELVNRPEYIDLVGPHGYIHGWIYVGGPGLPSVADHNAALRKKGITPPTKAHPALTRKPPGMKPAPALAAPAAKAPAKAAPPPRAAAPKAEAKPPEPPKSAVKSAPVKAGPAKPAASLPKSGGDAAKELDAAIKSGVASRKTPGAAKVGMSQGKQGGTQIVTFKNGAQYIHKDYGNTTSEIQLPSYMQPMAVGKEKLASKISDAIGAGAPPILDDKDSPTGFYEPKLEGRSAVEVFNGAGSGKSDRKIINSPEGQKLFNSPEGQKIGLMDLITGHGDRHLGNVMITPDGKPVPIDHNDTWDFGANGSLRTNSPFASALEKQIKAGKSPFTPADIDQVTAKIKALEPEFGKLPMGAGPFYFQMTMDKLAELRKQVGG